MRARIRIIQGGTSAGKTYAVIPILIDRALKKKLVITIVAETIPAVRNGALRIFREIMEDTNRWEERRYVGNPMEYRFANGSVIQFMAFDTIGKAKAAGKRDILFLNEMNHVPFLIADALMIRSKETYGDFNPDNEFYAHTEILPQKNAEFLLLTYLDNEGLSKETLEDLLIKREKAFHNPELKPGTAKGELQHSDNIKNTYWANWWKVYGLGEIGSLQGVVFENWKQCKELPEGAKLLGYGMDFGFTNDPTALVAVYQYDGKYYLDELIYETGLTNPKIADRAKAKDVRNSVFIYADSAEPKSIQELKDLGLRIQGADKGADSIDFGIQKMQDAFFYVTERSTNLIKEFRSYLWATDKKTGEKLNVPIGAWNHAIDAIRYFFLTFGKFSGQYFAPRKK